jgi:hypothetical protein
MPVFSSPNEYGSKLLLTLMVFVVVGFLAYIFLSQDSFKSVNKAKVSVTLNTKRIKQEVKKENVSTPSPNLPSVMSGTDVRADNTKDKIKKKIAASLSKFRHSLSIVKSRNFKGKVVKAKLYLDSHSKDEALNTFASFFAVCYGNKEFNTAYAVITLMESGNKKIMAMGIGRNPASSIPAGTWQRFDKMGAQLKSWILAKTSQFKGGGENACFYFEAK